MDKAHKTRLIKDLAAKHGFERCGIAPAQPIGRAEYVHRWLAEGRAGSMDYLHRHMPSRENPAEILPGAASVIMAALIYGQKPPEIPRDGQTRGRIAMYAWGDDYHEVIREKLRQLVADLRQALAEPFETRICVDTAPIIERELAAAAGIGWIGKNTLVLHPELGSYFFLGAVVTTLDLECDPPVADHCGTCTACLDACPTNAFPKPYQMDASRCISYLTIEHRGDISRPFQALMGDWVFGCDVCQEVCPFNRHAPMTREPRFSIRPPSPRPPLDDLAALSADEYRSATRNSAISRAKPEMMHRNAKIARRNAQLRE